MTLWSYQGKYKYDNSVFFASYSPVTPEKVNLGVVSKPGHRLGLFSEFKILNDNRSDLVAGFRARFQEGMLTGTMSTSGKAVSIFKHQLAIIELSFQS